ncbi:methionine--tRNA ligase [Edaphobacter aggregans]|uniref:methionine--tRNA ligase n=1 Tax=Edaphobacter aggregans TaxID=570835 RepID=UPI0005525804|nr:methionine--tRNA ligase [Edaphobacter aggregans]
MTSPKKVYVTTSIPYVNSKPHVGHALELIQADVIARHYRLTGHDVWFQTGTDENAFKNVLAAQALGLSTEELVTRNATTFRSLVERLNISADDFIRTTEERHKRGVIEFWNRIRSEDLYTTRYAGLYCVGCEDFYLERDLVKGCCPDHRVAPKRVEEENVFFRLSTYRARLEELISKDEVRIVPIERKNEVLNFIRSGLQDISISRSSERSGGWGIPVPGRPSQVIYVWIDALINYISGLGFGTNEDWRKTWNSETEKIHVIGKNVWKFHAVYWPALLLSARLPLPNELFVHGFLTENGRKISKSLGNAIEPFEYVDRFGTDGFRHFLLKAVSPFDDGDFSMERLSEVYESDLANGLGNLLSRVTSLCAKSVFPGFDPSVQRPSTLSEVRGLLQEYRIDEAAQRIWNEIARLNKEVAHGKPWEILKSGKITELNEVLARWIDGIHRVAIDLRPFLPETSQKMIDALNTRPIEAAKPLFPRIE